MRVRLRRGILNCSVRLYAAGSTARPDRSSARTIRRDSFGVRGTTVRPDTFWLTGCSGRPIRHADHSVPRAACALVVSRVDLAVGPFVGPNQAVLGRIGPSPLARDTTGCCAFTGTFGPDVAANAMLHTREADGSKPAAPIRRLLICRDFHQASRAAPLRARPGVSSLKPLVRYERPPT